jgi:tetratricopeptide (TPR) repeat protein
MSKHRDVVAVAERLRFGQRVFGENEIAVAEDMAEGRRLCDEGLGWMGRGKFKQAIKWLRKSVAVSPFVYTAANNLALCLFVTGNLEEAVREQKKSLANSPWPNPFGLANLATFLIIGGDEAAAEQSLDAALALKLPSEDATVKVCETLIRLKRHRAVLGTADRTPYGCEANVAFLTGVAAANIGDFSRAKHDLGLIPLGFHKADVARRYLEHLRKRTVPNTVRGDWPYFTTGELCPGVLAAAMRKSNGEAWFASRFFVDYVETMINDTADDPVEKIEFLSLATHPDAEDVLRRIVTGSFGPDEGRLKAMMLLREREAFAQSETVSVLLDGVRKELEIMITKLNPEFQFMPPLPDPLCERFRNAVKAGHEKNPDWAAICGEYEAILREAPDSFPFAFNRAVCLTHLERMDEAEPVLRELVDAHPEYLFAHALLLQVLHTTGRDAEAKDFMKSVQMPAETHPDAVVAWHNAQCRYLLERGDVKEAFQCLEAARMIDPDHPNVKRLQQNWDIADLMAALEKRKRRKRRR